MSLESEVAGLTAATTSLLTAVQTSKSTIDQAVADAASSASLAQDQVALASGHADTANTKAGEASGSAAQALAIYGNTAAVNTAVATAQAQANLAAGYAASAGSVAQQDLSGVNASLHRSPNAITAMFIYSTHLDSDGGAWTEKCAHTSWWNEPLNGKWLGAQASESAARAVSGAATGDYFQLTTDGKFYKLNDTSGTTEVFRGNKRSFPKVAGIVAEAANVTIYDLTEPGRPMFARFSNTSGYAITGSVSTLTAINGFLAVGSGSGVFEISFPKDTSTQRNATSYYLRNSNLANRNAAATFSDLGVAFKIVNATVNALAATTLPDAPHDPVTGLKVPTIAVAVNTGNGLSVIRHDGTIVNEPSGFNAGLNISFDGRGNIFSSGNNNTTVSVAYAPNYNTAQTLIVPSLGYPVTVPYVQSPANKRGQKIYSVVSPGGVAFIRDTLGNWAKTTTAKVTNTFNTGHLIGDIRRCFLSDTATGSVTGTVSDRSYKAKNATIEGTLTAAAVANNASLVAYSGFSAANYAREPFSADLDFGTGEWSVGAWVNVPTANAAAGTAASRAYSSGPYITLGIDATNKLTATAYDGTTTRTVTTSAAYNTGVWTKVRATYTTDGTLGLTVNGQPVATTTGAPLLTLNNASAVLTIGNSYALDAPFPGSISLLKFSATVPTSEQALWMYEQEKQLFREGAQCVLPSSGNVLDLAYDDETDTWSALQATHESTWAGLVRTATQTPSAGSFAKCVAGSGNKLLARTTTNPGVDIQMPSRNLRAELRRRRESLNASRDLVIFDYFGGFTATTTLNSTALTNVASSLVPSTTNLIGCSISGTGIPSGTVITGVSGTTIYMSKAATANGSNIQISTTDFNLPVRYTEVAVLVAGVLKREGSTADFTRLFDGFRETVRFAVAPGYNAWVQIQAVKEVA